MSIYVKVEGELLHALEHWQFARSTFLYDYKMSDLQNVP
jgi:hypothetical protein